MPGDKLIHDDDFVASLPTDAASLFLEIVIAGLVLFHVADDELVSLCTFRLLGEGGLSWLDALFFYRLLLEVGPLTLKHRHLVRFELRPLLQLETALLDVLVEGRQAIPNPYVWSTTYSSSIF